MPKSDEKGKNLYDRVRILCWVMTTPANHDNKALAVKETWGPRCNVLLFISTENGTIWNSFAQFRIFFKLKVPLLTDRSKIANCQIRCEGRTRRTVGKNTGSISLRLGSLSRWSGLVPQSRWWHVISLILLFRES